MLVLVITHFASLAAQQKLSAAEAKAKSAETDALQLCEKNTELVISSNCKDDELKVSLCMHALYHDSGEIYCWCIG